MIFLVQFIKSHKKIKIDTWDVVVLWMVKTTQDLIINVNIALEQLFEIK